MSSRKSSSVTTESKADSGFRVAKKSELPSAKQSKWWPLYNELCELDEENMILVDVPDEYDDPQKFLNNVRQGLRGLSQQMEADFKISIRLTVDDDENPVLAVMKK